MEILNGIAFNGRFRRMDTALVRVRNRRRPGVFVGGADESFQAMAAARSSIQPEGPLAFMTTRSILWLLKRVLR